MRTSVTTFKTPKDGSTEEEYEDASACLPEPAADGDVESGCLQIAIADGASESLLAGRWAQLLVREFTEAELKAANGRADFASVAALASARWSEVVTTYVKERESLGRPLKWYEEPGLARGAYATLLVVSFSEPSADFPIATWRAAALGDSCLFHVRADRLVQAFPLTGSADFGVQPDLLNSQNQDEELVAARNKFVDGTCEQDDHFFLCTDALAAWFLEQDELGRRPWTTLVDLGSAELPPFEEWVADQRSAGLMRNDDVTLVRVDTW